MIYPLPPSLNRSIQKETRQSLICAPVRRGENEPADRREGQCGAGDHGPRRIDRRTAALRHQRCEVRLLAQRLGRRLEAAEQEVLVDELVQLLVLSLQRNVVSWEARTWNSRIPQIHPNSKLLTKALLNRSKYYSYKPLHDLPVST